MKDDSSCAPDEAGVWGKRSGNRGLKVCATLCWATVTPTFCSFWVFICAALRIFFFFLAPFFSWISFKVVTKQDSNVSQSYGEIMLIFIVGNMRSSVSWIGRKTNKFSYHLVGPPLKRVRHMLWSWIWCWKQRGVCSTGISISGRGEIYYLT